MNDKILEMFKELSYLLSMDNEGHLHKVIMEIDYVKEMYERAIRIREDR